MIASAGDRFSAIATCADRTATDLRTLATALEAPDTRVGEPGKAGFTLQHHLGLAWLAHSGVPAEAPPVSAADFTTHRSTTTTKESK